MLIYDLLKNQISLLTADVNMPDAKPNIYRRGDKVVYCNCDDGEILAEQDLLTGNGTYEDGQNKDSWTSSELHQLVSLHQSSNSEGYLLAVTSYPSKESAQKRYQEEFSNVVFAGYVNASEEIEIVANLLPNVSTTEPVTGWSHFVNKLLTDHSHIFIGVSSDIPNDSGLPEDL